MSIGQKKVVLNGWIECGENRDRGRDVLFSQSEYPSNPYNLMPEGLIFNAKTSIVYKTMNRRCPGTSVIPP